MLLYRKLAASLYRFLGKFTEGNPMARKKKDKDKTRRRTHGRPASQRQLNISPIAFRIIGASEARKIDELALKQEGKIYIQDIRRLMRRHTEVVAATLKVLEKMVQDGLISKGTDIDSHGNKRVYFRDGGEK